MNPSISRQRRQKIFAWIVLGCVALAIGYTSWVIMRANTGANQVQAQGQGATLSVAGPDELEAIQKQPHLLFVNMEASSVGQVKLEGLDSASPQQAQTALTCERVHYAAGNGICLMYDSADLAQLVTVTLFDSDFTPRHQLTTNGLISRARVSPDGRFAAFTVFVTGHSYMDADMSTATFLVDTATGANLGNLEEFETWKDGQLYQAPEFNFWGVTFTQDSNRFYATLQNRNTIFLVEGDVAARKLTVLHENVECPSLSPDGTRIAFKKRISSGIWQLMVLDLATMQETPLAEKESIDDQVEWLDNERILYHKLDYNAPLLASVFVLPANGTGKPEVFIPNAISPVVVR